MALVLAGKQMESVIFQDAFLALSRITFFSLSFTFHLVSFVKISFGFRKFASFKMVIHTNSSNSSNNGDVVLPSDGASSGMTQMQVKQVRKLHISNENVSILFV